MIIVKEKEAKKNYVKSNEPSAQNWEFSLLWHGGKKEKTKGIQGPFSCLNRTSSRAIYPRITLKKGTMEYFIIEGEFSCNGKKLKQGDYAIFEQGETMKWKSPKGGEMLIVLKGELTWYN